MRYTETKERSAELLRVALGYMGRHSAALNPFTFALWYEYASGANAQLHAAVGELMQGSSPFGDDVVERLYQEHIAPSSEADMRRISGEIQRVMNGIAQSATSTGDRAGQFGAQLEGLSAALESNDMTQLSPHLSDALAGTAEMKSSAEALQQQVRAGQDEIAQLREDLDRARGEALVDPLTGILNRKGFDQKIEALLALPENSARKHCLIMLDIDHFKKVNDSHGHVMGDRVIQGIGQILRHVVTDDSHAAARYGGEEFAIVLPHITIGEATRLAELVRLRAKAMKIRNRNTKDVLFSVTISGGVTALERGDDAGSLIARADRALYESKRTGRDRVSCG